MVPFAVVHVECGVGFIILWNVIKGAGVVKGCVVFLCDGIPQTVSSSRVHV